MEELFDEVTFENYVLAEKSERDRFKNFEYLFVHPDSKNKSALWIEEIDRLADRTEIDKLECRNLTQEAFEYLADKFGRQIKFLNLNVCQNIGDFSPLEKFTSLEFFRVYWNTKAEKLWDTSKTQNIKSIKMLDFSKLHDLSGAENLENLKMFSFGNFMSEYTAANSYNCFANTNVEFLCYSGNKLLDNDLSFLHSMPELETFDFNTNCFTTEQVAWIAANFPDLKGYSLCSKIEPKGEDYVIIVGKRKPSLKIKGNEEKIKRYDEKFKMLVEKYRGINFEAAFKK